MNGIVKWVALAACSGLAVSAAAAADRAIIVLDASGSMLARIDGKTKMDIAREALENVLRYSPDELELGLEVYGHRSKGDCDDIETLVEPRPTFEAVEPILSAARSLKPLGKTPIAAAVRKAAETLKYQEDTATVILITDGEDTCASDPCAVARELEGTGVNFTTHVVGFGLSDEEGRKVACLAEETGGKYIQASDQPQLELAVKEAVQEAAAPPPPPEVEVEFSAMDGAGAPLSGATSWTLTKGQGGENLLADASAPKASAKLAPGDYTIAYQAESGKGTASFTVAGDQPMTVEVAQTEAAEKPEPADGPVLFEDTFEGEAPKPDWEVRNPDTDKYVVEDSELLLVASGGNIDMISEAPANLFVLKQPLASGDWDMTATVQLSVQTGRDRFAIGVYKDPQNFVQASLSIADSCENYPILAISKWDKGQETKFEISISEQAPISSHYCGGADQQAVVKQLLNEISEKGVPLTFSKRGRRLTARITVTNPKDGTPVELETGALTALRLSGDAAMLLGQYGDATGESLAYVQDFKIVQK